MFEALVRSTATGSAAGVIIALGLGSIVFFSTIFIVIALLIRGRWDEMGQDDRERSRRTSQPPRSRQP